VDDAQLFGRQLKLEVNLTYIAIAASSHTVGRDPRGLTVRPVTARKAAPGNDLGQNDG
jgi:hypothetical protein